MALQRNRPEVIEQLLAHGAEADAENIALAEKWGRHDILYILLEHRQREQEIDKG